MEKTTNHELPLKNNLPLLINLTIVTALMMAVISALGLLIPDRVYPDPMLLETFLANDLVNLILGLPLVLFSLILLRRGKVLGLLLLPGFFIYVIYNYIGYLLGRPISWMSILDGFLVVSGMTALLVYCRAVAHEKIKEMLEGRVSEKVSGWILVVFGLAFIALAVSTIISGIREGTIPPLGENAVSIADIVVSLGWVWGGILLLRSKPLGFSVGLGLLVAASFLFMGLVLFFFIAPLVADRAFDWIEVITVLVMGLICFIPTGIFWRGIVRSNNHFHEQE